MPQRAWSDKRERQYEHIKEGLEERGEDEETAEEIGPARENDGARVSVLAPSPLLTVTLEGTDGPGDAEVHLHPGGQGFWIARLIGELGGDVVLCATFGGETGRVVRSLLEGEPLRLRMVQTAGVNGAYVDDRRGGERVRVGTMAPAGLSRHEVDELYGAALVEGLDATMSVLGGPGVPEPILPADIYRRLAADLVANDRLVVADLSGEPLEAAVDGGATVVKVSHEELLRDRLAGTTACPPSSPPCEHWAPRAKRRWCAHERTNPRWPSSTAEPWRCTVR